MKISELLNESQGWTDAELIKIAREVGEKMYGKSNSGLVFDDKVTRKSFAEYTSEEEGKPTLDTFDYIFYPSSKKGKEAADTSYKASYADTDGNIYVAGRRGVFVLSPPFKKGKPVVDEKAVEEQLAAFKKALLKHWPEATFKDGDKYNKGAVYGYSKTPWGDSEMVGQFYPRGNAERGGKPSWYVHDTEKRWGGNSPASHNW